MTAPSSLRCVAWLEARVVSSEPGSALAKVLPRARQVSAAARGSASRRDSTSASC